MTTGAKLFVALLLIVGAVSVACLAAALDYWHPSWPSWPTVIVITEA